MISHPTFAKAQMTYRLGDPSTQRSRRHQRLLRRPAPRPTHR